MLQRTSGIVWALLLARLVTGRSLHASPNAVSRLLHTGLNETLVYHSHQHVHQHPAGREALQWLLNDTAVIPSLAVPSGEWASNLVIGYAGGYDFQIVKPLIYGFLANADKASWLVLLIPEDHDIKIPDSILASKRIVLQRHAIPKHLGFEDIPYPVSLRFYITNALLRRSQHEGTVFFLDTRDVFIQRDPFQDYSDGVLHFPRESGAYRLRGPFTSNSEWIRQCYDNATLDAIGGNYVLNSGTLIGPTWMMLRHFELLLRELESHWHCRRLHGSDQAIHNYLVYTGKVAEIGLKYQIEDQVGGQFAFMAYTHPGLWDFRYVSEGREEMYNKPDGKPMVAIHMWPGDNRAAKNIVQPFVEEYDKIFSESNQ